MRARFVMVLMVFALSIATLPFGGCGDNDNSAPVPCCPVCGDGVCGGDENGCNCGSDCDGGEVCTTIKSVCGDGVCQRGASPSESHERCPEDCPLDCRVCAEDLQVFLNGETFRGSACPPGSTRAYRDGIHLVCHGCNAIDECPDGKLCTEFCGPGCEDDTSGCCPVRACLNRF